MFSGGRKQLRYTYANEGFIAQNANHEIFGLGNETHVDSVIISWLSGIRDTLQNVAANQEILIIEGDHPVGIENEDYSNFTWKILDHKLQLHFTEPIQLPTLINLIDLEGKLVYTEKISAGQNDIHIPIHTIPSSIYFIEARNTKGSTFKKIWILK